MELSKVEQYEQTGRTVLIDSHREDQQHHVHNDLTPLATTAQHVMMGVEVQVARDGTAMVLCWYPMLEVWTIWTCKYVPPTTVTQL